MFRTLSRVALALAFASTLDAQPAQSVPPRPPAGVATVDPLHQSGANVTISLLTMGSGTQVWEMFGHNALLIHDNVTGRDTVFNWGVFSFKQPNFIARFLQGRMLYAMGSDSLRWVEIAYTYLNRSVVAQELDLTTSQKDSLLAQVQWYGLPENVNYRYDYFRDNCSTRVRDILDHVLNGQFRAGANGPTGTTYRWHALRLMQGDRPLALGVDIALGRLTDKELTKWEEMFLPRKLHDYAASFQIRDSAGGTRPLVRGEVVMVKTSRGPEYAAPPSLWPWLFGAGVAVSGLFMLFAVRGARRSAAVAFGIWSTVAGLLGLVLTLLWAATDHVSAYANENLLLFNPLWLLLTAPLFISMWKGEVSVWTRRLAVAVAALSVVALLVHVFRLSSQDNLALIGLALPPALAIAWTTVRARTVSSRA